MPIAKPIHKYTRVVPVRFDRCPDAADPTVDQGTFDANAPDPDDRGFLPATVRGPILPIGLDTSIAEAARPETRMRLIREDIENAAQLFVTTNTAGVVQITLPVANAALPNTRHMMIRVRALAAGNRLLQVRFGAIDGPIIAQMQLLVTAMQQVRVVAHAPTINGAVQIHPVTAAAVPAQTVRTDAQIRAMFDVANAIYFPYGVRFTVDAAVNRTGVLAFQNQGMVDDLTNEFNNTTASNRVNNVVNAYFVPQIANPTSAQPTAVDQVHGVANSARTNPRTFGLLVGDAARSGHVVAHELGHLLNLPNDPQGRFVHIDTVTDPAAPGTGRQVRADILTRRRLMYAFVNIPADAARPYRTQVGYGMSTATRGQVGGMITIKQYDADKTDLEHFDVLRTAGGLGRPPAP
jgi:hypothetical protein